MKAYLLNAFSLQMVDAPCIAIFEEVDALPDGLISAIGHADTAKVLGVEANRVNVHLSDGDIAYVAQLQGGRLPEGSTVLPDGFSFKFIKVKVVDFEKLVDAIYESYSDGCLAGNNASSDKNFEGIFSKYFGWEKASWVHPTPSITDKIGLT